MDARAEAPPLLRKESDQASSSRKRPRADVEVEPNLFLPSNDRNAWYYPGLAKDDDDDDEEVVPGTTNGNWGKKNKRGARFVRRGHIAAWGPGRDEYDIEERARKRLRAILPEFTGEPLSRDPILPHLRSPSPPMIAPYAPASTNFTTYTQSIFDPNIGASFRSNLLHSLERSASELIQSEIALTRALGRLWTALTEKANELAKERRHAIMEQEKLAAETRFRMELESTEGANFVNSTGDPTLVPSRLIYPSLPDSVMTELDTYSTREVIMRIFTLNRDMKFEFNGQTISLQPAHQVELVARSLAGIRELQEDSKECMERLEEIREMLGRVRGLRDAVWAVMRSRAITEMENEE